MGRINGFELDLVFKKERLSTLEIRNKNYITSAERNAMYSKLCIAQYSPSDIFQSKLKIRK
jgi:hypothetical protein